VAELAYDHIESIVRKRAVLNICLEPFDLNLCDAGVLASIFQKFGCEVSSIDQGSIARGGDSYNSRYRCRRPGLGHRGGFRRSLPTEPRQVS